MVSLFINIYIPISTTALVISCHHKLPKLLCTNGPKGSLNYHGLQNTGLTVAAWKMCMFRHKKVVCFL